MDSHGGVQAHCTQGMFHYEGEDVSTVVWNNGRKEWFFQKCRHREDGPAIVHGDHLEWYLHGDRHREDGPAVVNGTFGTEYWFHGKRHRDDGPALITRNGTQEWYQHGQLHRTDGPAMITASGAITWVIHDETIKNWQRYQSLTGRSDDEMMMLVLRFGEIR